MPSKKSRKFGIDLPRQPLVDQRPWLAAGIIIAVIILLMCSIAYIVNKK